MLEVFDSDAQALSFNSVELGDRVKNIDGLLISSFDKQEFRGLAEVEDHETNEEQAKSECANCVATVSPSLQNMSDIFGVSDL